MLRGRESNPRPLGYEPNELPLLLPRDVNMVEMTGVEPVSSQRTIIPTSHTLRITLILQCSK